MKRFVIVTVLSALLSPMAYSGGVLDRPMNLSRAEPSPFPGEVIVPLAQDRWADNCIPVRYSLNTTKDSIRDPNGGAGLPLNKAGAAIRRAMAAWNNIPTSYIEMELSGTTDNPGFTGLDFINEVSFTPAPPLLGRTVAASFSFFLNGELTLAGGEDIDLDGDSDVSAAITTCGDVDGDGDMELPAGFYPAGTIIDNDVQFNSVDIQWVISSNGEIQDGQAPKRDVQGAATHEFGHSHGLAHSMLNQTSSRDGDKATMWIGFRADDMFVGARSLHTDDIAWSSFHYPEDSTKQGPGALQDGDIAFKREYSVISGEVRDPNGIPVLGANVYAEILAGTIVSSAISGHAKVSVNPQTGSARLLPPELGIMDGRYQLPVLQKVYRVGIEAADRAPNGPNAQTLVGTIGGLYGQNNFAEEVWNGQLESAMEVQPGVAKPVPASKDVNGINFMTEDAVQVLNVNEYNQQDVYQGLGGVRPGLMVAVRVPTHQIVALDEGNGIQVQAALFGMAPTVSTSVPIVDAAMITTGQAFEDGTATINLQPEHPLERRENFVGQDTDLAPLYLRRPKLVGTFITQQLAKTSEDIFLVVVVPEEEQPGFPGTANVLMMFDLLEPDETTFGYTYISFDGGKTFQQAQSIGIDIETYFGLMVTPR